MLFMVVKKQKTAIIAQPSIHWDRGFLFCFDFGILYL